MDGACLTVINVNNLLLRTFGNESLFFVSVKIFETRVLLDRLRNHKANEARALEESAWDIAREKERRNERERERENNTEDTFA